MSLSAKENRRQRLVKQLKAVFKSDSCLWPEAENVFAFVLARVDECQDGSPDSALASTHLSSFMYPDKHPI